MTQTLNYIPTYVTSPTASQVEEIPNFETLINTYEDDEIREHNYAVPSSDPTVDLINDELMKQLSEVLEKASSSQLIQPKNISKLAKVSNNLDLKLNTSVGIQPSLNTPDTPIVLDSILSMDEDEDQNNLIKSKLLSSVSEFCASLKNEGLFDPPVVTRVPSPISSDSDYESIHSPASVSSDNTSDVHFDCSNFDDLFPSLF